MKATCTGFCCKTVLQEQEPWTPRGKFGLQGKNSEQVERGICSHQGKELKMINSICYYLPRLNNKTNSSLDICISLHLVLIE